MWSIRIWMSPILSLPWDGGTSGGTSVPTVSHGPRTCTFPNFVKLAWCHLKPSFVIESKYINSRWCIWKWWCTTRLHAHWWALGVFFSSSKPSKNTWDKFCLFIQYIGAELVFYDVRNALKSPNHWSLYSKAISHCPSLLGNGTEVCLEHL